MSIITDIMKAQIELDNSYERTWEEWRLECNAKGLEIYYDTSNMQERSVSCDCDDDCGEPHILHIGQYKTRPCTKHFEGHRCNPPRYAKITNLSVSGLPDNW